MSTVLIQYRGGGYSGCVWEWNYAVVTGGNFYGVYSSGARAINSLDGLRMHLREDRQETTYVYNLNRERDWKEFVSETNAQGVLGVAKFLDSENIPCFSSGRLDCPHCGRSTAPDEMHLNPADYSGDGGVGVNFHSYICNECLAGGSCNHCGEFYGDDSEFLVLPADEDPIAVSIDSNYGPLCQWCFEKLYRKSHRENAEGRIARTISDSIFKVPENWRSLPHYQPPPPPDDFMETACQ